MHASAPLALALVLAAPPMAHRPTTHTPARPAGEPARASFALRQYADAGYPGDRGFVTVVVYPTAHAAAVGTRTDDLTATRQPYTDDRGATVPSPRGTWTRLVMTPDLCVAVSGGARGRTAVMATDESATGVGSPDCVAEVRWAQAHAVAALRAGRP